LEACYRLELKYESNDALVEALQVWYAGKGDGEAMDTLQTNRE
jgi:hypothetical protein